VLGTDVGSKVVGSEVVAPDGAKVGAVVAGAKVGVPGVLGADVGSEVVAPDGFELGAPTAHASVTNTSGEKEYATLTSILAADRPPTVMSSWVSMSFARFSIVLSASSGSPVLK